MGSPACSCLPCFRENVIVTCKIVSFLCRFDNFLLKTVFLEIKFQNGAHLEKRAIFELLFTFLVTREKTQKYLQNISYLHTYTYFAHSIDFFALPILKKIRICHVWCLFGVTPGVDSFSLHFVAINK